MDTIVRYLNKKNEKRYLLSFVSTFIIGFLAHSFIYYNKISFHDDLSSIEGFSANILFTSGRYFQGILKIINDHLFGTYSNSFLNGIVSLLIIAIINILIVKILNIKKNISIIFTSSIITVSTGLLCLYAYMFTAVLYAVAILISVISTYVFIYYNSKYEITKILLVSILMFLSITIYQSYFLFGTIIYLYYLLINILENKFDIKECIFYIVSVLIALILLKIANSAFFNVYNFLNAKFNLMYNDLALSSYQGIGDMTISNTLSIKNILNVIKQIFISDEIIFSKNIYIYYIFLILALFMILCVCASKKLSLIIKLCFILITISIFLATNSLYLLSNKTYIYALPLFPKCLIFLLPIIFIEYFNINKYLYLSVVVIFMYFIMFNVSLSNSTYLNRFLRQINEISWCETLATRIQSVEGYNDDYDIYCYGEKIGWDLYKNDKKFVDDNQIFDSVGIWNVSSINQYNFSRFMERFTGFKALSFKYNVFNDNADLVKEMPCYPDDGSIKVVGDSVYIKFSEIKD